MKSHYFYNFKTGELLLTVSDIKTPSAAITTAKRLCEENNTAVKYLTWGSKYGVIVENERI